MMNDVDICVLHDAVDALCRWPEVSQLSSVVFSILVNVFPMSQFY